MVSIIDKERVDLTYTSVFLFITEGSQDRDSGRAGGQRQELTRTSLKSTAYWLAS